MAYKYKADDNTRERHQRQGIIVTPNEQVRWEERDAKDYILGEGNPAAPDAGGTYTAEELDGMFGSVGGSGNALERTGERETGETPGTMAGRSADAPRTVVTPGEEEGTVEERRADGTKNVLDAIRNNWNAGVNEYEKENPNPSPALTEEEKKKAISRTRLNAAFRGIGDLGAHIANIWGSNRGSKSLKINNSLTGVYAEKLEKRRQQRKAAEEEWRKRRQEAGNKRVADWAKAYAESRIDTEAEVKNKTQESVQKKNRKLGDAAMIRAQNSGTGRGDITFMGETYTNIASYRKAVSAAWLKYSRKYGLSSYDEKGRIKTIEQKAAELEAVQNKNK